MTPQPRQRRRSSSGVAAGTDIKAPHTTRTTTTRHDDTAKSMVLRRFRRTMRRLFGGRWKQMSDGEIRSLEKQVAADMRAGTFRPVERTVQPPTADDLWQQQDGGGAADRLPTMSSATDRLPTMSSATKRSTVVSQASRGQYYDDYGDDYGGYQDAYEMGGGAVASSDSGYGPGYYDRAPPRQQPPKAPEYYVPSGGPFDMPEARPESVYDGGGSRANSMRANSMRSNFTTRTASRRPPTQGYYPPVSSGYGDGGRAYSMRSDPGRIYARSPMPRPHRLRPQPSWDGRNYGGGGGAEWGGYGNGIGVAYGGDYGYRGWEGHAIEEHEYPPYQGEGIHYEDYQYPER
ncbi:hypothetical protein diail_2764 [Diaporthe ilicicola]|nr:hypothetical protein diail_2764 [Diaporthe ilicicola]